MKREPVLIEIDADAASPAEAPPVPDMGEAALPAAMAVMARPAGRVSRLGRWLGVAFASLLSAWIGIALWDFVSVLLLSRPLIGWTFTGLIALVVVLLLGVALREWLAFRRLGQLDKLQDRVADALESGSRSDAVRVVEKLKALYRGREDLRWKLARVEELMPDQMDADSVLGVFETEVMDALDKAALTEIEAASRRVATVTALVPIALLDVLTALATNMRMVRAVAQVYGGRSGTIGSWRLVRAVIAHLVATGAVAIGDDLIGSVAGGALAGKISRRFGEGVINGALTARVGITAMTLCRPMPFTQRERPKTATTVKRALVGVFRKG
jgi:putative membrane protein